MTIKCGTKCFIKHFKCHAWDLSLRTYLCKIVRSCNFISLPIILFWITAWRILYITINHYDNYCQTATGCSKRNAPTGHALFKDGMTNASYIDMNPCPGNSFVEMRNCNKSGVLRFIFMFTRRAAAKRKLAGAAILSGTGRYTVLPLKSG